MSTSIVWEKGEEGKAGGENGDIAQRIKGLEENFPPDW